MTGVEAPREEFVQLLLWVSSIKDLKSRVHGLENRLFDDELYRFVWSEIESDKLDPVAKLRALEDGGASEQEIRSAYVKHRILSLKDQLEAEKLKSDAMKADAKNKIREADAEIGRKKRADIRSEVARVTSAILRFIVFGFFSLILIGGVFGVIALSDLLPEEGIGALAILAIVGWFILWGVFLWKLPIPAKTEDSDDEHFFNAPPG